MQLEDLRIYQLAMETGDEIWKLVSSWNSFEKNTLGNQLVRSSDSIAANISEGYGRYHYKDAMKFYYYSRGSLYETKTWLVKANNRDLIDNNQYTQLLDKMNLLGKMLNKFIQTTGQNIANEDIETYGLDDDNTSNPLENS